MATITIDRAACEGYANCVLAAGGYFDVDDDDVVVALHETVLPADLETVRKAAIACPTRAIKIVDG